jgi:hypothetical protein
MNGNFICREHTRNNENEKEFNNDEYEKRRKYGGKIEVEERIKKAFNMKINNTWQNT